MGNTNATRYLNAAKQWIADVAKELGIAEFNIDSWVTELSPNHLPQQEDGTSCGVFLCMFAILLSDDISLDECSKDLVNHFRRKLCLYIANQMPCEKEKRKCPKPESDEAIKKARSGTLLNYFTKKAK